ncbi:MAG: hypothetical protein WBW89_06740 [Candidatus Cybelea sp.]
MRTITRPALYAIGVCSAVLLFAGCGAPPTQGFVSGPAPPNAASQTVNDLAHGAHPALQRSWMAPEAKHESLVYASNAGNNTVSVYNFLTRKMVGMLTGIDRPWGLCSDQNGDVWVVGRGKNELIEYPHASTQPIKTLHVHGWDTSLIECSVDPTTGNLAVTNYGPRNWYKGDVLVFENGEDTPYWYDSSGIWFYFGCSYDDKGNLWVDGWDAYLNYYVALGVLPKNGSYIKAVSVIPAIKPPMIGNVQWTGANLALGDWQWVLEVHVKGSYGHIVGYTPLTSHYPVGLFWVTNSGGKQRIIAPDTAGHPSAVQYWKYPDGGNPTATITDGLNGVAAVTFSAAHRR